MSEQEKKSTAKPSATLESVKATADAAAETGDATNEDVVVEQAAPEGLVKVKNITNVNIFTSKGKILAKGEGFCTQEDADALKDKELALEI